MGERKRGSTVVKCILELTNVIKRRIYVHPFTPLNRANSVATKVGERTCNNDPPPPLSFPLHPIKYTLQYHGV